MEATRAHKPSVVWPGEIRDSHLAEVGPKAASLARMLRAEAAGTGVHRCPRPPTARRRQRPLSTVLYRCEPLGTNGNQREQNGTIRNGSFSFHNSFSEIEFLLRLRNMPRFVVACPRILSPGHALEQRPPGTVIHRCRRPTTARHHQLPLSTVRYRCEPLGTVGNRWEPMGTKRNKTARSPFSP